MKKFFHSPFLVLTSIVVFSLGVGLIAQELGNDPSAPPARFINIEVVGNSTIGSASDDTATVNATLTFATPPAFTTGIIFEGATADANETTLDVTDPTADQTYRLPNNATGTYNLFWSSGSTTLDAANAVWGVTNGVRMEGTTADGFETTLSVVDPTVADATISIPNNAGTSTAMLTSTLTTNAVDVVNSFWGISNGIAFEGASADGFEVSFSPVDPTVGDSIISIPNLAGVNGTMAVLFGTGTTGWAIANGQQLQISDGTNILATIADGGTTGSFTASGTVQGDALHAVSATATDDRVRIVPGSGGVALFTGEITVGDLTADRQYVLPNAGGTFAISASGNMALSAAGDITISATPTFTTVGATGFESTAGGVNDDAVDLLIAAGGAASFTGTIGAADLTAARAWTLPNAGGTFAVSATAPATLSAAGDIGIAADGIDATHLADALTPEAGSTIVGLDTIGADPTFAANALGFGTTGLIFEGATGGGANAFETLLTLTDPTADRTITLPDATGTVAVSATAPATLSAAGDIGIAADGIDATHLADALTPEAGSTIVGLDTVGADPTFAANAIGFGTTGLIFEGATGGGANAFEGLLTLTDPTADRTWTLPDATGTIAVSATAPVSLSAAGDIGITADAIDFTHIADALTPEAGTSIVGADTIGANPTFAAEAIGFGTTGIIFEGATGGGANASETLLTVTDPTADRTLTLPDDTGTVALLNGVSASSTFSTLVTTNGGLIQDYSTGIRADAFSAAGLNVVRCEATTADLATITGGVLGQVITLVFDDAVVLTDTAYGGAANTLALSAAYTSTAGSTITFVYDGNQWTEVARSIQ